MDAYQKYYDGLNSEQKKAVDIIDGPLLVLAGPGTGKTQLLSVRAANILKKTVTSPENILILTFTNSAARAMRERLAAIVGNDGYSVVVETFHSFANSIVLESEGAIKYVKDKIDITEVEKVMAIRKIIDTSDGMAGLKPFGAPYVHLNEIGKRISELKNEGISPEEFRKRLELLAPDGIRIEEKHVPRLAALAIAYEKYESLKDTESTLLFDSRGRKDFDDMILIAVEALKSEKELRDHFYGEYRYIMVDEYQDTNGAQMELLFSILREKDPNLCCVGDDDQSIYRFQGATLSNFRILSERFEGLTQVTLKDNYRSTGKILDVAGQVISQLPVEERVGKKDLNPARGPGEKGARLVEFLTVDEEMAFLVREIRKEAERIEGDGSFTPEEREKPFNNIAILVRKRSQRQRVIEAFLKAGIPYASDGKEDIRMEKRVSQMMDVLELADVDMEDNEKKSLALYKVLTSDYMKTDHSDILAFIRLVKSRNMEARKKALSGASGVSLFREFLKEFPAGSSVPPGKDESAGLSISAELGLKDPGSLHRASWAISRLLVDARNKPVHDMLMRFIEDTELYGFILDTFKDNRVLKTRDLRSLVAFINQFKEASFSRPSLRLDDFMDELELKETHGMPLTGELATQTQDGVRVFTAHSAKGLEFSSVFMPFCLEQKSWPVRSKPDVVPLPPGIYKSKEKVTEKGKKKLLSFYDELRLFYVAVTRAKTNIVFTATPGDKAILSRIFAHTDLKPENGSPPEEDVFLAEYMKGRTDRDPFDDTDGVLKDLVKDLELTPTKLNNYISCKRKFLYNDILRLPGRKTQHLVFGNCVHKALEDVYTVYMEKKNFPVFGVFKNSFKKELEFQGVTDEIKKICLERLDRLEDWYLRESRSLVMPDSLEKDLSVLLPGNIVFKGKFDKVEVDADGRIKVIDYKTGKPDKHVRAVQNCRDLSSDQCDGYYRQLVAYKMIFDRNAKKGKTPVSLGELQFLEPASVSVKKYDLEKGKHRDIELELTEDMVSDLERLIRDSWDKIQGLQFDKLPERDGKERCARCEFDGICWER